MKSVIDLDKLKFLSASNIKDIMIEDAKCESKNIDKDTQT